jgi:hypothetical protein
LPESRWHEKAASAAALGFAQRFLLLLVQVAEVQRPQQEFFFGDFVPEAGEGVTQLFGDTEAEEEPAVLL